MCYYSEARTLHFERRGAERSGVTESRRVRQKPDALARACPGFAARVNFYEASRQISARTAPRGGRDLIKNMVFIFGGDDRGRSIPFHPSERHRRSSRHRFRCM